MTTEELWLARVLVLHSIRRDTAAPVTLVTLNLASPPHILRSLKLLVRRLILMLMMIQLVLLLVLVAITCSPFALTTNFPFFSFPLLLLCLHFSYKNSFLIRIPWFSCYHTTTCILCLLMIYYQLFLNLSIQINLPRIWRDEKETIFGF